MQAHVSPCVPRILPDVMHGHWPVRAWEASAQVRICSPASAFLRLFAIYLNSSSLLFGFAPQPCGSDHPAGDLVPKG